MKVQVARWGNSTAVRLPKALVDELKLQPGQTLDVTVSDGAAHLRPCAKPSQYTLEGLVAEAKRVGLAEQPPLEDWSAVEPPWPED